MKDIDRMATLPEAADWLWIPASMLEKLIKEGNGPEHTVVDGKAYFDWDDLDEFRRTRTICRDGSVIGRVKARVLGSVKRNGKDFPVVACFCSGLDDGGARILKLIAPDGTRNAHKGEKEFGSGDGHRAEGYFAKEVTDPVQAGFDDSLYLGDNALYHAY